MSRFAEMFGFDSLMNLVTGLGTPKDKTTGRTYLFQPTARDQLLAAYRGDWIARKMINIPAEDATREWRQWTGEPEQVEAIEEAEKQFKIREVVLRGMILSRLYGGAGVVIGDGSDPATPIREELPQGSLAFVNVAESWVFSAGEIEQDITNPNYGLPTHYRLGGASSSIQVDPSRIIRMVPRPIPDIAQAGLASWGDSLLETMLEAAQQNAVIAKAVSIATEELNLDIVRTPDFMRSLANEEYRKNIIQRFSLASQAKSVTNTLLLDKEDEWERMTQTFAGVPDMMKIYLLIASAVSDIPATRFLSQSPSGLSATGESDLRNYYDSVASDQQNYLANVIEPLDRALAYSTFGSWPDGLEYEWRPLWQMTEKEKAEVAKLKADTHQVDVNSGLFNDDLLREARSAQLDIDGVYPGWSALVEEHGLEPDEEEEAPELGIQPLPMPIPPPGNEPGGPSGPPGTGNPGE